MKTTKLQVKNSNLNYSIIIGKNIFSHIPGKIKILCPNAKKIALVVDKNIPKKFKKKLINILKTYDVYLFEYSANEKFKSYTNVNKLVEKCLFNKFNRNDILISFGGGILGDLGAFAASIIKRGINFINIPTTLLSQVDSSIGGKTGVNSKYGKNLIGTFYQPKLVVSDVEILKSLPQRELVCGYAEMLKHSLILKGKFFNWLKKNSSQMLINRNLNLLQQAIIESCKIKIYFVNKDVYEKNIRMILNFGHTFAHAIELQKNYSKKINHGEAVLLGIKTAAEFSLLNKILNTKEFELIENHLNKLNLPRSINKLFSMKNLNKILSFMKKDKKNNTNKINLVLLKKIGSPIYKLQFDERKIHLFLRKELIK